MSTPSPVVTLTPKSLRAAVTWLAAPEREGRAAGTAGARAAADYIAAAFRRAGLQPALHTNPVAHGASNAFFHPFDFPVGRRATGHSFFHVNGSPVARRDTGWEPAPSSGSGTLSDIPVVASDAPDVRGAAVVFTPDASDTRVTIAARIADLRDQGASAVLITANNPELPDSATGSDAGLPVVIVPPSLTQTWLDGAARVSLRLRVKRHEQSTANVVGILEGSDPVLKNEYLLVAAHYDHLGLGGPSSLAADRAPALIHPGADDNASGVAGVLALAHHFARAAVRPKRSLIFACFSAEERGLLGSAHYVKCPPVPLAQTVAMFNLDMIGRLRARRLTVLGTGTASDWPAIVASANETACLTLNSAANVTTEVGGSDHQTFIGAQIPTLFFFTGLHADYHKPTDTADKINGAGLARVARFVAGIVQATGDAPTRPVFVAPPAPLMSPIPATGMPRPALGTIPEYGADAIGVRLGGVRPGSPADKAGLRAGDVLTSLGGQSLRGVEEFAGALYAHAPGDTIAIEFVRRGKPRCVLATLEASLNRR